MPADIIRLRKKRPHNRNENKTSSISGDNFECVPDRTDGALHPLNFPLCLHGSGREYDSYSRIRPLPGMPVANRCYCFRDFAHSPGRRIVWCRKSLQPNSPETRRPDSTPSHIQLNPFGFAPIKIGACPLSRYD